jgi:mRNA-degrading endonuclease YafQ of YafQ-DinJ toxin-antitoxin module
MGITTKKEKLLAKYTPCIFKSRQDVIYALAIVQIASLHMIAESPIALGEPLKGNFRGYYSCPVRKNFLIIFLYCSICRKRKDDQTVLCSDCSTCSDDTIKFIALGPHDKAYLG